jgi:hypothetical protein
LTTSVVARRKCCFDGWLLDGWLLDGWLFDGWLFDEQRGVWTRAPPFTSYQAATRFARAKRPTSAAAHTPTWITAQRGKGGNHGPTTGCSRAGMKHANGTDMWVQNEAA